VIARGSTQECVPLLQLAVRQDLLTSEAPEELRERLETIAKMISGLINGFDRRAK
jgi:four helix bundle protein